MAQNLSKSISPLVDHDGGLEPIVNQWTDSTWENFVKLSERPEFCKATGYYFDGQMRIETVGVGTEHGSDNAIVALVVSLFCMTMGIPIASFINSSYRKPGSREVQPDLSYYVGDRKVPSGPGIADLNKYPAPNLAIEIAVSSLSDDLGKKRLLYEALGIDEYWVVDVAQAQVIGFQINSQGSHSIRESIVLPGLTFAVLEQALVMSRSQNHTAVGLWLMQTFQASLKIS